MRVTDLTHSRLEPGQKCLEFIKCIRLILKNKAKLKIRAKQRANKEKDK